MKKLLILLGCCHLITSPLMHGDTLGMEEPSELIVYNRILATFHGKTISVIDVMKKMDLFLQRHYPEYIHSKAARFQFYTAQWKETFAQMINQELILADAERLEVKVSDADVREEMLQRFGPNVIATLDEIDLTYDEARQLIHSELIVQRMMWFRVHSKAFNRVKPQDIKVAYQEYCTKNPAFDEWEYEVLSIRSKNAQASELLAHKAFDLLQAHHEGSADTVATQLQQENASEENPVTVTLSQNIQGNEKTIAEAHKAVLQTLQIGDYSQPVAQVNRIDQGMVYRIFHLKNHKSVPLPFFGQIADKLKDQLLEVASEDENREYIAKLRARMGYNETQTLESIPTDFQPFALR